MVEPSSFASSVRLSRSLPVAPDTTRTRFMAFWKSAPDFMIPIPMPTIGAVMPIDIFLPADFIPLANPSTLPRKLWTTFSACDPSALISILISLAISQFLSICPLAGLPC